MQIDIRNRTPFETTVVRRVFKQVLRDLLKRRPTWKREWDRRKGQRFIVEVTQSTSRHSGYAFIGLGSMWEGGRGRRKPKRFRNMLLRVPPDCHVPTFAAVIEHELYHSFGVGDHADYPPRVLNCDNTHFAHYPELLNLPESLGQRTCPDCKEERPRGASRYAGDRCAECWVAWKKQDIEARGGKVRE